MFDVRIIKNGGADADGQAMGLRERKQVLAIGISASRSGMDVIGNAPRLLRIVDR